MRMCFQCDAIYLLLKCGSINSHIFINCLQCPQNVGADEFAFKYFIDPLLGSICLFENGSEGQRLGFSSPKALSKLQMQFTSILVDQMIDAFGIVFYIEASLRFTTAFEHYTRPINQSNEIVHLNSIQNQYLHATKPTIRRFEIPRAYMCINVFMESIVVFICRNGNFNWLQWLWVDDQPIPFHSFHYKYVYMVWIQITTNCWLQLVIIIIDTHNSYMPNFVCTTNNCVNCLMVLMWRHR